MSENKNGMDAANVHPVVGLPAVGAGEPDASIASSGEKAVSRAALSAAEREDLLSWVDRWRAAGCAVHPAKADGSKKPVAVKHASTKRVPDVYPAVNEWGPRKGQRHPQAGQRRPDAGQFGWGWARVANGELPLLSVDTVRSYIRTGQCDGVGIFCGVTSGGLEMVEVEAPARVLLPEVRALAQERGVGGVLERLEHGCVEQSASGGFHYLFRVTDGNAAGNEKLALRTFEGIGKKVAFETRGQGGWFVAAPSGGRTHSSGRRYHLLVGGPENIPGVTVAERDAVYAVLRTFDEGSLAASSELSGTRRKKLSGALLRVAKRFNSRKTWREILEPHGWAQSHSEGDHTYWTRPGKESGVSASTTDGPNGRMCNFSSSVSLPLHPDKDAGNALTRFDVFALLNHGGDFEAAARASEQLDGDMPAGAVNLTDTSTCTDLGLARRLAWSVRGRAAFVVEAGEWVAWDGRRWARHGVHEVARAAKELHDTLGGELGTLKVDDDVLKQRAKFVMASGSQGRLRAAEELARSEKAVAVHEDDFDCHPWLLNCRNGVVDLRTGKLRSHDSFLRLTQLAEVEFVPGSRSELWEQFIHDVTCGDEEIAEFLQQVFGVALTGDVSDEIVVCHNGSGGNGKSTAFETIGRMLGDYSAAAPPSMFVAKSVDAHPTEVAHLRRKRFVTGCEGDGGRVIRDSLLKMLTGGDTVATRGVYENFREMRPSWHLHLAFNRQPRLSGVDDGMRRRLRLVPWNASFVGAPDLSVKSRLVGESERPGILCWCLEGLRKRLEAGRLVCPAVVMAATDDYLTSENAVGRFLDGHVECEQTGCTVLEDVVNACRRWVKTVDGAPQVVVDAITSRSMSVELGSRGFRTSIPTGGRFRKKTVVHGLRLYGVEDLVPADAR